MFAFTGLLIYGIPKVPASKLAEPSFRSADISMLATSGFLQKQSAKFQTPNVSIYALGCVDKTNELKPPI